MRKVPRSLTLALDGHKHHALPHVSRVSIPFTAIVALGALASCEARPDAAPASRSTEATAAEVSAPLRPAAGQDPARRVSYLRIPGPVQFVLGDPVLGAPRRLPVEGYARDGGRVTGLEGTVGVRDPEIATLQGLTMTPHLPGATIAWANAAGRGAGIGVHVYGRVASLAALDTVARIPPTRRLVAMPLRLLPGEFVRQALPPGGWMLSMLPEADTALGGPRLRVEGAHCAPVLTPRRFVCDAHAGATIIVYRPVTEVSDGAAEVADNGTLLARWLAAR